MQIQVRFDEEWSAENAQRALGLRGLNRVHAPHAFGTAARCARRASPRELVVAPGLSALGDVAERAVAPLGAVVDEISRQRDALAEVAHRPWPLPNGPWLMGQTWHDLLFAHWAVPKEAINRLLPPPLTPQLRNGCAWLGMTPFVVSGLRLRGMPPLPWLSRFPELNLRTYVEVDDKPGIYFFSLDTARMAAVRAARRAYRLPYFHAEMRTDRSRGERHFTSIRRSDSAPPASMRAVYRGTGTRTDDPLARWLAERYCLYVVDERGAVLRGDIHHPPWPLELAVGEVTPEAMAAPLGIRLEEPPLLHYSARQDVALWPLTPA